MTATIDERLAGGGEPGDFCTVRHITLHGDQVGIGMRLAELAERHHGASLLPSPDPVLTRARRRWLAHHYPQLAARAEGIARHFGAEPGDDRFETATLPFGFPSAGCSAAWVPPGHSTSGGPLISRNFDFPTQTLTELMGGTAAAGEPVLAGQPYLIETYPDVGHATLVVCLFDLASGAVDGINEAGLVAALLADDESSGAEPTYGLQAGLGEHEVCRYLLETCETADDAIEALRAAKQYYSFVPCHYLVADRTGAAFVWEYSPAHNREHILRADGPLAVTNHLLYRYPTLADLPAGPGNGWTYDRARTLTAAISQPAAISPGQLKTRHAAIQINEPGIPVRTLWHAIYDPAALSMDISFYLGDTATGTRRSAYQTLQLLPSPHAQAHSAGTAR
jgi:Acyl-coenzyme A:6-aminopenicillanic acid acyl-transferase